MKHPIPETPPGYDHTRIVERPDGCYWVDAETGEEYGPFANLMEAVQDMEYNADSDYEPGETVEEAITNLQEATALYLSEFPIPAPGHPLVTTFSVPAHA